MINADALKALQDYYDTPAPKKDDEFKFTEALGYLGFESETKHKKRSRPRKEKDKQGTFSSIRDSIEFLTSSSGF